MTFHIIKCLFEPCGLLSRSHVWTKITYNVLKTAKYEVSDKKYLKNFFESKEVKVIESFDIKGTPFVKLESSNTVLIRSLESEINRENYRKSKERTCINDGSCSMDSCEKDCPFYTSRETVSIEELKSKFSEFDIVDRGPSVEDKVIRKEMIRGGLKELKKKDAVLARITKMALLGDSCEFISLKTGMPKSTVSDMLKKANEFFSKLS